MKVTLIIEAKDRFKAYLKKIDTHPNAFYFENIETWQEHWNVEAKDLDHVYDASLQSKFSARLWGGSTNSPKSLMIRLMREQEEFMRSTFRDLFNENLDLGLRLDRFGYHADQVLRPMQEKDPKIVSHFHHDREILCLYLAFEYPEKYCLFDYPAFEKMMINFESRNIPTKVETERYYKSCRGIYNLLMKDEEVVSLIKSKCNLSEDRALGLMVMSLFMEFVGT